MRNGLPFSKPRVRLYGATGEAQNYLGAAYNLLYKVRQFCEASGTPVFGMQHALPDGAMVQAAILGNEEIVSCYPPSYQREVLEQPPPKIPCRRLAGFVLGTERYSSVEDISLWPIWGYSRKVVSPLSEIKIHAANFLATVTDDDGERDVLRAGRVSWYGNVFFKGERVHVSWAGAGRNLHPVWGYPGGSNYIFIMGHPIQVSPVRNDRVLGAALRSDASGSWVFAAVTNSNGELLTVKRAPFSINALMESDCLPLNRTLQWEGVASLDLTTVSTSPVTYFSTYCKFNASCTQATVYGYGIDQVPVTPTPRAPAWSNGAARRRVFVQTGALSPYHVFTEPDDYPGNSSGGFTGQHQPLPRVLGDPESAGNPDQAAAKAYYGAGYYDLSPVGWYWTADPSPGSWTPVSHVGGGTIYNNNRTWEGTTYTINTVGGAAFVSPVEHYPLTKVVLTIDEDAEVLITTSADSRGHIRFIQNGEYTTPTHQWVSAASGSPAEALVEHTCTVTETLDNNTELMDFDYVGDTYVELYIVAEGSRTFTYTYSFNGWVKNTLSEDLATIRREADISAVVNRSSSSTLTYRVYMNGVLYKTIPVENNAQHLRHTATVLYDRTVEALGDPASYIASVEDLYLLRALYTGGAGNDATVSSEWVTFSIGNSDELFFNDVDLRNNVRSELDRNTFYMNGLDPIPAAVASDYGASTYVKPANPTTTRTEVDKAVLNTTAHTITENFTTPNFADYYYVADVFGPLSGPGADGFKSRAPVAVDMFVLGQTQCWADEYAVAVTIEDNLYHGTLHEDFDEKYAEAVDIKALWDSAEGPKYWPKGVV